MLVRQAQEDGQEAMVATWRVAQDMTSHRSMMVPTAVVVVVAVAL